MKFTDSQREAIHQRGNVLVMAGAGTGKTSTLVERCIHCMTVEPRVSIDKILMVTFTEAAATEMRHRIRVRMEQLRDESKDSAWWEEQLSLFDTAHIGTLHSFCLKLIRQHFYELELDPQVIVMTGEDAYLQQQETLDRLFKKYYTETTGKADAVQELIQVQGEGRDEAIRELVVKIHEYSQTLRDAEGWLAAQIEMFREQKPTQWQPWLIEGARNWAEEMLESIRPIPKDDVNGIAAEIFLDRLKSAASVEECFEPLAGLVDLKKTKVRKKTNQEVVELKAVFEGAGFLHSLARPGKTISPLEEDWNWVNRQMVTLLELAQEFTRDYGRVKRELAGADFHDLEQLALKLLWKDVQPSAIAHEWRAALEYVFVDEYQDINEAQDAILAALGREGAGANRFLVGDVKQSIYRFRLADPKIFQAYAKRWGTSEGSSIALSDNFRSREAILGFVNSLFSHAMVETLGGVSYDAKAHLIFGDAATRSSEGLGWNDQPRVEFCPLVTGGKNDERATEGESEESLENLEKAAKEARMAAWKLRQLKESKHLVWDRSLERMREIEWSDMAVLLRAPRKKMEYYSREFARLGVPLTVSRGGFYGSLEVTDLLSLLEILDNPLQDIPTLAVLRSPLVGMGAEELATIRMVAPRLPFWTALVKFVDDAQPADATWKKANRFLEFHAQWRRLIRLVSLSRCLEMVVQETHYADWLLVHPNGEQSRANVERLLALARQFDRFQRQSLPRFLRFVQIQRDTELEPVVPSISGEDAVQLMSVHQSKGLEFPVVLVADLAKNFNMQDLSKHILLDEKFGLCPQIRPENSGRRYPSLPQWLARQRQKRELLGEELRLLYVAMTRARDTLILTGAVSQKKIEETWPELANFKQSHLTHARTAIEWLASWMQVEGGVDLSLAQGGNRFLRWDIFQETDPRLSGLAPESAQVTEYGRVIAPEEIGHLKQRINWKYPEISLTRAVAKTTVTQLRKELADAPEEAPLYFKFDKSSARFVRLNRQGSRARAMSAAAVGTVHHRFLSRLDLRKSLDAKSLKDAAARMVGENFLTSDEAKQLNFASLEQFWASEVGRMVLSEGGKIERELAFTARFSPAQLARDHAEFAAVANDEFVVVQGIADLVVIGEKSIMLVDFKTDDISSEQLAARTAMYAPQVQIYARALCAIYRKPVTQAWLYFLELGSAYEIPTQLDA